MAKLHCCEGNTPSQSYGYAITSCSEDENGKLWATNDEYVSQVAFCPYCGFKATVAPEVTFASDYRRCDGCDKEKSDG